jgi:F0F1-type ATP synthase delta subunit
VSSPVDVGRLTREIEAIDESLLQLGLRKGGSEIKMPKTTQLMDQLIELNKLNLLQAEDRKLLLQFLVYIKQNAPVLHVSFSADPNTAFIEKLMAWLRREINPLVLMTVGLQPNIGAGCIIRSTNKYFDLSLKQDFASKTSMLRDALVPAPAQAEAPVVSPAPTPEAAA